MRSGIDCKGKEWEKREMSKKKKDISGKKVGLLTVLFPIRNLTDNKESCWLCSCECGNLIIRSDKSVKSEKTKSCGCLKALNTSKTFAKKREDMINRCFGKLTVVDTAYIKETCNRKRAYYRCVCNCGRETIVRGTDLRLGKTTSCGSCSRREAVAKRRDDLTSKRFGKLTVVNLAYIKNNTAYWHCICDCGNEVDIRGADLINSHTSSCGCALSIGELNIMNLLNNSNITYLHNKGYFKDLVSENDVMLRYDFIILDNNKTVVRLIEFDGPQHDNPSDLFGNEEFKKLKYHDDLKNQYALSHNIPLVRIPYYKRDSITLDDIFDDKYLYKGEI